MFFNCTRDRDGYFVAAGNSFLNVPCFTFSNDISTDVMAMLKVNNIYDGMLRRKANHTLNDTPSRAKNKKSSVKIIRNKARCMKIDNVACSRNLLFLFNIFHEQFSAIFETTEKENDLNYKNEEALVLYRSI